ncbi:hypothetical protein ACIP3U_35035 [[Kitasatospora] papulosa]
MSEQQRRLEALGLTPRPQHRQGDDGVDAGAFERGVFALDPVTGTGA